MNLKNQYIQLLIIIVFSIFTITPAKALLLENCLETINLDPDSWSEEESAEVGKCLYIELINQGMKPCNQECLSKLTPLELKQHIENRVARMRKILDEEQTRRTLQTINIKPPRVL
jgi:hypothetical protein